MGAVDWYTPRDAEGLKLLVEQHGHFVRQPDKYAVLRVPAGPNGRDFTLRRGAAGEPGKLEWSRPRYELPGLDPATRQTGVEEVGERWNVVNIKRLEQAETVEELEGWARLRFPKMEVELAGSEVENARETLAELDRLGRLYREVEDSIPTLRVLPAEEFGELGNPLAFAATGPDRAMKLNGWHYGDREWFDIAWAREITAGGPALPARAGVMSHEMGEAYRMWLQQARPNMWSEVEALLVRSHPPQGMGVKPGDPVTEGFAQAFAVMHQLPKSEWSPYVREVRRLLRYEVRVDF